MDTAHGFFSQDEYLKLGRRRSELTDPQKTAVYSLFLEYEKMKGKREFIDALFPPVKEVRGDGVGVVCWYCCVCAQGA